MISTIPLDHAVIKRAQELVPAQYHGQMWVAGSAATHYPMNGDVDIWVAEIPRGVDPWKIIPNGRKPPSDGDEEYMEALKVFEEPGLQIMGFRQTMQLMLDTFDISCHAAAVHLTTGETLFAAGYSPNVKVVNFSLTRPELTLERYLRFAKRYRDWDHLTDPYLVELPKMIWDLHTSQDLQQQIKWGYIDRGL